MRLFGILSGTVTADDRPQWMGDVFTLRFVGAAEETTYSPGASLWLNIVADARSQFENAAVATAAVWRNVAASSPGTWLNN